MRTWWRAQMRWERNREHVAERAQRLAELWDVADQGDHRRVIEQMAELRGDAAHLVAGQQAQQSAAPARQGDGGLDVGLDDYARLAMGLWGQLLWENWFRGARFPDR